jgi:hypothetical protein
MSEPGRISMADTAADPGTNPPAGYYFVYVKNGVLYFKDSAGTVTAASGITNSSADTLTNKKLSDTTTYFISAADATKALKFLLSGQTTGKTLTFATNNTADCTLQIPAATADTFALLAATQTLSNKTITHPDGAVATPSVAFDNQTNTGLYALKYAGSTYGIAFASNGTLFFNTVNNTGAGNPFIRTAIRTLMLDGAVNLPALGFEGGAGGLYRSGNGLMSFTDGTNRILDLGANGITNLKGYVNGTRVVTAAGAVTVATTDYCVVVNKSAGAATAVNLPASPATGLTYIIKDGKRDAATNNITITPAAGNIEGAATYVINTNGGSAMIVYSGTEWLVVAKY